MSGNKYAVRLALQLHRVYKVTLSDKLEEIFNDLILINPELLLEELKENEYLFKLRGKEREILKLEWIIDGHYGMEFIGLATKKYVINQKKIMALKSVKKRKLRELRNKSIKILEEDQKNLEKYCFILNRKLK